MVFISDKKYACETCIKGHRSSSCKHTDRPLFEIKKKGRPVTQCEHCRELRKTKQVHVKCICESKSEIVASLPASKRGGTKIPDNAAFPNGLPEAMEASAALHLAEGTSSDSDHGGIHNSCSCAYGGDCHCCTPRKSVPEQKRKPTLRSPLPPPSVSALPPHIMARVSEMRTVLPRPPVYGEVSKSTHMTLPWG
ncbi:copper fist DNA binding domain-containing protein [Cyathus striatus]|nr:copper fist DNA binding domain-containing protein [Cyathus striatus]